MNDPSQTKREIVGGYVLLATTVPNGNGEYRFEDLPEGSYQVEVVMDDYEPEATDEITLSDEETFSDINFMLDTEKDIIIVDTGIPTGIEDNFVPDLKVYPIPFTDVLHITCAAAVETMTRQAHSVPYRDGMLGKHGTPRFACAFVFYQHSIPAG